MFHFCAKMTFLLVSMALLTSCTGAQISVLSSVGGISGGMGGGKRLEQHYIRKMTLDLEPSLIKSIALLSIPNPPYFHVRNKTMPTTFFDNTVSDTENISDVNTDVNRYAVFDFPAITQQKLTALLEAKGYKVTLVSVDRKKPHEFLKEYKHLDVPDVDVFLDLAPIRVGYLWNYWWDKLKSKEVGPYVAIAVRMVEKDSGKVLYEESLQYSYFEDEPRRATTIIQARRNQSFKDFDYMEKQKEEAKERLADGIDAILENIVGKISP